MQSVSVGGVKLSTRFSLLTETRDRDENGAERVACPANEMGKPVQCECEGIVDVASEPHTDAEERYAETRHGHPACPEHCVRTDGRVRRGSPYVKIHDEEAKILYRHHGGVEHDLWLVFWKREHH